VQLPKTPDALDKNRLALAAQADQERLHGAEVPRRPQLDGGDGSRLVSRSVVQPLGQLLYAIHVDLDPDFRRVPSSWPWILSIGFSAGELDPRCCSSDPEMPGLLDTAVLASPPHTSTSKQFNTVTPPAHGRSLTLSSTARRSEQMLAPPANDGAQGSPLRLPTKTIG
jgi:hypothetical protein